MNKLTSAGCRVKIWIAEKLKQHLIRLRFPLLEKKELIQKIQKINKRIDVRLDEFTLALYK